jgi:hypothetical protein
LSVSRASTRASHACPVGQSTRPSTRCMDDAASKQANENANGARTNGGAALAAAPSLEAVVVGGEVHALIGAVHCAPDQIGHPAIIMPRAHERETEGGREGGREGKRDREREREREREVREEREREKREKREKSEKRE